MFSIFSRLPRRAGTLIPALLTALFIAVVSSGCTSSDSHDTLELLSTVPADAEAVGVLQLNTIVGQTGGKVKDGRITDAAALEEACKKLYSTLGNWNVKYHEFLFAPDSGLEASSAVLFKYKGATYLSALIADEQQLLTTLDKITPGDWDTEGKIKSKGEFAIRAGRFWTRPEGQNEAIEKFANLSEVESFRSNAYAETLSKATDAFAFWGSIDGILKASGLSFSQLATTRMALGMFFNSPTCLAGQANIEKDWLNASVRILDNNLKPSKCELAVSKIDTQLVSSLGGNANAVIAAAVSQKLVKQVMDLAGSFGGSLPKEYASALEPLDGTIVFASSMNPANGLSGLSYKGAVQTSGKSNALLLQLLQGAFKNVTVEGDTFHFGTDGYGSGVAPLADVAKDFEGAWLGVAGAMHFDERPPFYYFSLTIVPADNSLRLDFKLDLK